MSCKVGLNQLKLHVETSRIRTCVNYCTNRLIVAQGAANPFDLGPY